MLDEDEKEEPGADGNRVLYHSPQRHVHDAFQLRPPETDQLVQPVSGTVYPPCGVDDEKEHRYQFRQ